MHKFKIVGAKDNQFRVQFVYNAEVMVWSENYASKASANDGAIRYSRLAPGPSSTGPPRTVSVPLRLSAVSVPYTSR